ncbi:hypothetical protein O181_022833 [Austropuccinia psidii MF-1]|uniref:Uncharacterized protein n=1 Tax=Austropuccinia psidii MF-1 TaxID=1389203 RepID=A0A9Q3CHP4_9BASI|nr:hypothetical protein [Austropuccinia psidii MF-1]
MAHFWRSSTTRKEGRGPRTSSSLSGVVDEEEENSVEERGSDGTEGVPDPVGESQGTGGPNLAQSNLTSSDQSETSLFAILQQMTQNMANLQEASSSES